MVWARMDSTGLDAEAYYRVVPPMALLLASADLSLLLSIRSSPPATKETPATSTWTESTRHFAGFSQEPCPQSLSRVRTDLPSHATTPSSEPRGPSPAFQSQCWRRDDQMKLVLRLVAKPHLSPLHPPPSDCASGGLAALELGHVIRSPLLHQRQTDIPEAPSPPSSSLRLIHPVKCFLVCT
jgi:hypothetical protein